MKNRTKLIATVAGGILLAGLITTMLFRFAMGTLGGITEFSAMLVPFGNSSSGGMTYNGYPVDYTTEHTAIEPLAEGSITSLSLAVGGPGASVTLATSDRFEIEYHYFGEVYTFRSKTENGRLTIWEDTISDAELSSRKRKYKEHGLVSRKSVSFQENRIEVRYPASVAWDDIQISMRNGDFSINDIQVGKLDIDNDYGNVMLKSALPVGDLSVTMGNGHFTAQGFIADSLDIRNDYGKVDLTGIQCGPLAIEMGNGRLDLTKVKAGQVQIDNNYGDVTVSGYTAAGTDIQTGNGRVRLDGTFNGKTDIRSNYGEVELSTAQKRQDYNLDLSTDYGEISIDGQTQEKGDHPTQQFSEDNRAGQSLLVDAGNGDIRIRFGQAS